MLMLQATSLPSRSEQRHLLAWRSHKMEWLHVWYRQGYEKAKSALVSGSCTSQSQTITHAGFWWTPFAWQSNICKQRQTQHGAAGTCEIAKPAHLACWTPGETLRGSHLQEEISIYAELLWNGHFRTQWEIYLNNSWKLWLSCDRHGSEKQDMLLRSWTFGAERQDDLMGMKCFPRPIEVEEMRMNAGDRWLRPLSVPPLTSCGPFTLSWWIEALNSIFSGYEACQAWI